MKILLSLTLSLFLLAVPASAAEVIFAEDLTDAPVNELMKNGWKLHTVSSSDNVITYTLIKKRELITCFVVSGGKVECFKP